MSWLGNLFGENKWKTAKNYQYRILNIIIISSEWKLIYSDLLMIRVTVVNVLPLDHSMSLASFYTPWKHQKTSGFLMFSGGIERDQWHEMGQL